MTAGIHRLPVTDYVRDPAPEPSLSASVAHTLLTKSPRHAWIAHPRLNPAYTPDHSAQADIGTIAHAIMLEGNRSRIVVVDADDWRTKAAREVRDAARLAGKVPVLANDLTQIDAMVTVAKVTVAASELEEVFADGVAEDTLLWQEGGTWCRSRPDWHSRDWRVLVDYKTTKGNAEPDAWARGPLLASGYDLQAALGLRGAQALASPPDCAFVFMVQEVEPPYAVSFIGLAPAFVDFADRKLAAALTLWRECLARGQWPAFPSRICWAHPPEWAVYRWTERAALAPALMPTPEEEGVESL